MFYNNRNIIWWNLQIIFQNRVGFKYPFFFVVNSENFMMREIKGILFSYPKLLSFSVLTFIKWRLTPSYAAKDTIFWQKRPKTIIIGIQIYSYDLLCEPVLSMRTTRKMKRSEISSKWNKCRIYVGDQLDRWNELKEVLRVQIRAEVAKILLDR